MVNDIIPRAREYLEGAITVNRISNTLKLPINECAGADISEQLQLQGFDADFVVFITGWNDAKNVGSWAHPCVIESDGQNHPLAGRLWLHTYLLDLNDDGVMEDNVSNIIH